MKPRLSKSVVQLREQADDAVWVGEDKPAMWSTYDGTSFTQPTDEYLISIGILNPPVVEEPTE